MPNPGDVYVTTEGQLMHVREVRDDDTIEVIADGADESEVQVVSVFDVAPPAPEKEYPKPSGRVGNTFTASGDVTFTPGQDTTTSAG